MKFQSGNTKERTITASLLSEKNADVIRATLPVVGENIGTITKLFYTKLFEAAPSLKSDVFNRSNQARGEQQKALAGSIANFATLLISDTETDPRETIGRIAHKHASLGVSEDQYQVVHKYLFEAIVEVLGEAVTADVAEAWDAVYWLLANALIDAEKKLYLDSGVENPATVFSNAVVVDRIEETSDVISLVLEGEDGKSLGKYIPGQYLSIGVVLPDGARQIRQYSITKEIDGKLRIAVKRDSGDPKGEVSNFIHDTVVVGSTVQASPPFGDVHAPSNLDRLVLVSKGVGNAPFVGILNGLVESGDQRAVVVIHADKDEDSHPYRNEVIELLGKITAKGHSFIYGGDGDVSQELDRFEPSSEDSFLLCGSVDFLEEVNKKLQIDGVDESKIAYEVFGPDSWLKG